MAEMTELTDEMKAAIGTRGPTTVYEVTTQGIRTFARAVGYRDPVFYDEDEARKRGHPALLAPPGFLGMPRFNPFAPRMEGRAEGRALAFRSPFRRVLNGGTRVEPLQHVYAGDVLEAVTTLKNLELRDGRLGKMLIRTSETVYTRRSDSAVVARTTGTGISY
jgi:acyl dehydratase